MTMFELMDVILEEKLKNTCSDVIDIKLTRDQAKELYGMIHRIVTFNKNMKKGEEKCQSCME